MVFLYPTTLSGLLCSKRTKKDGSPGKGFYSKFIAPPITIKMHADIKP
jgi:hypothetical protein